MPSVLDRGQVVADKLTELEALTALLPIDDPVKVKVAELHKALDGLRRRFGVPYSAEGGPGVIAFSSNGDKDQDPPAGGGH